MKLFELEARPYQEKDFPRHIMPQIRKEHLIDSPFDFQTGEIPITKLKPVQSERVKGMHDRAKRGFDDGTIRPIIIDNDNFIVNGHHRYDVARGMDMEDVDVIKVDATIEELIKHYSNTADKQPTIEDKWKKNLKKKIKKMPKKISGSSSNILFNLGLAETIEAGQDFNALLQGIESDLKQREKDLKRLPKKSIYSEGEVVSGSEAFPTYELWKFPKDIKVNSEKLMVTQNLEEIEKYLRSQPSSISHIFKVAKNGSYMDLPEFNINSKFANAPTNEDVSQLKPQTSGTKRPLFSPQRSQKAYEEWLNGAAVDTDIEIVGNDNQLYYIRQNTDGESQHFKNEAWYLTDADYEIVDTEGYSDPGDLLFSHSATGYEPIDPNQIDEGPKDFDDMKLDSKGKQDSIDYFYHEHAPKFGQPVKAGRLGSYDIVTFLKGNLSLMFLVDNKDQAVFYIAFEKYKDGVAVGNVRSNGTVKATEVYSYLVKKHGKLYSDGHQTPSGRKIWDNLTQYTNLTVTDVGDRLMATENFADDIVEYYNEIHPVVIKAWKSVYPNVPLKVIDDEDMYMQYTTADEYELHGGNGKDFYLSLGVQYVGYEEPPMGYVNVGNAYAGNYKGVVAKIIASLFEWLEQKHPNMGVRELGIHMNRNAEAWDAIAKKVGAQIEQRGYYENFKDGKKPGRKGLAKRSGVNTKASVSSLRKTAKNSTGEKQRMAHWLANMKAGRKKKSK